MLFALVLSFIIILIIIDSDEKNWEKNSFLPINNDQQIHTSSSIIETQKENPHISTNAQSMKSYPSSNTIVNEQSTSPTIQTSMSNQPLTISSFTTMQNEEYDQTTEENKITTIDTTASTLLINRSTVFFFI